MEMRLPSTQELRTELIVDTEPLQETSVVQFGCEDCPNQQRLVSDWLSVTQIIGVMDSATDVPRAFVSGNFFGAGKATPCELDPETNAPQCAHKQTLKNIPTLFQAQP